jgi:TrmH family RNA methyltransferase
MKEIKSLQNPIIKHLVSLRKDKKYRGEKNSCLIIGNKIVNETLKKIKPKTLITTDPLFKQENAILVSDQIMKKITDLPSPETLLAEISLPKETEITNQQYLLVLDKIKDPGNLGTLIRTAHGLKWDGVIITPNSVDPYNDKALRSAKGSTFSIPIFFKNSKEILELIKNKQFNALLADIKGKDLKKTSPPKPLLLILSSESHGSDKWAENIPKISIPMRNDIDSLNVAISGAICMYEIRGYHE